MKETIKNSQAGSDRERHLTDEDPNNADEPTDPRPFPAVHVHHLDVDKVLERSLPRVSGDV
jgi:hypothetical protein